MLRYSILVRVRLDAHAHLQLRNKALQRENGLSGVESSSLLTTVEARPDQQLQEILFRSILSRAIKIVHTLRQDCG